MYNIAEIGSYIPIPHNSKMCKNLKYLMYNIAEIGSYIPIPHNSKM